VIFILYRCIQSQSQPIFYIDIEDENVARTVDKTLSYYKQEYERTTAYKQGKWDGMVHLLKKAGRGRYYFPIGLIERVKEVIEAFGDTIVPVYTRNDPQKDKIGLTWKSDVKLRDYQFEALTELRGSYTSNGVICLPTGSGKTILALKYILFVDRPFLILVHRKELMYQWKDEIQKHLGVTAALIGDGIAEESKICTVAMIQSLFRDKAVIPSVDMVVIDECHVIASDMAYDVAMSLNAPHCIGLSATPHREDNEDLKIWAACGGLLVSKVTVEDLVDLGYLAKPVFRFVQLSPIRTPRTSKWHDIYNAGIVSNEERNHAIMQQAVSLAEEGRQVYVHVSRIDHGEYLALHIKEAEPTCVFLNGSDTTKVRKQTILDFKSGKIRILVSTLLKEGVDIPSIDALIYAAANKSSGMVIQTIGRALRCNKEKENAIIVDFMDTGNSLLALHWELRFNTYVEAYGKYCRLNVV
jgi:superfamily II DNA or RNA helicase